MTEGSIDSKKNLRSGKPHASFILLHVLGLLSALAYGYLSFQSRGGDSVLVSHFFICMGGERHAGHRVDGCSSISLSVIG